MFGGEGEQGEGVEDLDVLDGEDEVDGEELFVDVGAGDEGVEGFGAVVGGEFGEEGGEELGGEGDVGGAEGEVGWEFPLFELFLLFLVADSNAACDHRVIGLLEMYPIDPFVPSCHVFRRHLPQRQHTLPINKHGHRPLHLINRPEYLIQKRAL